MTHRRAFIRDSVGALGALGAAARLPSLVRAVAALRQPPPARGYANAVVIDAMATDGPGFDARVAVAAGITAAIVDMSLYPRSFHNGVRAIADWNAAFRGKDSLLLKATRKADVLAAKKDKKLAVMLACQDAAILDASSGSTGTHNLANLGLFYDLGLRVLQLTHNERNSVGDSFREKMDAGLSRLGERVVDAMNAFGMLIDLSHCSTRTTLQAIAQSRRPCLITHAGCRALYPTPRNKTDEEIRSLAQKGGVFGVFNMSLWLTARDTAAIDDVLDHLQHAINVGGVEHVAFGSDGPVLALPSLEQELEGHQAYARANLGVPSTERVPSHVRVADLNSPHRLERLAAGLGKRGLTEDAIDKVIGGNVLRVIGEVCG
jgi:membrane dipeptidase